MSLDNFEVEKKLSQHIYKVRRIQDNKIYALKKATIDDLSQKEIQNAINEVRFLASIRHPNVVSYKEAFYDPNSRSIWYRSFYEALWHSMLKREISSTKYLKWLRKETDSARKESGKFSCKYSKDFMLFINSK